MKSELQKILVEKYPRGMREARENIKQGMDTGEVR